MCFKQTVNPGNLKSGLQRHHDEAWFKPFANILLYPAVNGAYSELFAGLSPVVTMEKTGSYSKPSILLLGDRKFSATYLDRGSCLPFLVLPWGRIGSIRSDLALGALPLSQGGTGMAEKWFEWCLEQVRSFV
jgi:retinol dehydrogenase 12